MCAEPQWERQMKSSLQSNVMSLDIGNASGTYANTSGFIYASWNRMPDYALEYVVERDQASSRLKEQTGTAFPLSPPAAAAAGPGSSAMTASAISSQQIDAVLTPRQRDVFELIVQGMSNKEIARNLQLAEGTVKIHIKALFAKLGVRRRAAVAVAGTRLLSSPERGDC
jgi:DNA-binding CsgD family transcriptional regulator